MEHFNLAGKRSLRSIKDPHLWEAPPIEDRPRRTPIAARQPDNLEIGDRVAAHKLPPDLQGKRQHALFRPFDCPRPSCRIKGKSIRHRQLNSIRPGQHERDRMTGISIWKLLIILGVVLLLFSSRLPTLARSLGQSIVEFKKGIKEIEGPSDEEPSDRKS